MAVVVPDLPDIFEEAYERAGVEMQTGYELSSARRSLNLLFLEWQNRGFNMFMVDAGTLSVTAGTATYTMPTDTIDLLEHHIRLGSGATQTDYNLVRMGLAEYANQANKNTTGRPSQIYVDRASDGVNVTLWPVPDADYTLAYYRMKGLDGVSSGIGTTAGVPPRFIPCLIAGLAYHIAMKRPELADRAALLKPLYEEEFARAAAEDEARVSLRLTPSMRGY